MTSPLAARLARLIRLEGPLSVARYMSEALSHPEHGYYMAREPFGREGDFITAPEISQMFGEMIGLWAADLWSRMGAPSPVNLVEIGPGRGTCMKDVLRAAKALPPFREAVRLHLVETSPALRARQRETLQGEAVRWHDGIDSLPEGPLILIANEFFDALPIHQYQRLPDGWHERLVDVAPDVAPDVEEDSGALRFTLSPAAIDPRGELSPAQAAAPVGAIAESCPAGRAVAEDIARRIARFGGAALIIDYGPAASAAGDSLQAVKAHRFHPPLETPGEADLTAHVDFERLAEAALKGGAQVFGPVTQGDFLSRLGIAARAEQLRKSATPAQAGEIGGQLERLTAPGQMGSLFKVLCLGRIGQARPAGFDQ